MWIKQLLTNRIVKTYRSMWARSIFRFTTFTLSVEIHTVTGTIINFILWCNSQLNWSFLVCFATVTSIQVSKWIIKGTWSYIEVEFLKREIYMILVQEVPALREFWFQRVIMKWRDHKFRGLYLV